MCKMDPSCEREARLFVLKNEFRDLEFKELNISEQLKTNAEEGNTLQKEIESRNKMSHTS